MNLSERIQKQINEINPATLKAIGKGAIKGAKAVGKFAKTAGKSAGKFAKTAGKKVGKVAGDAVKRNAVSAEAAITAGIAAPIGQKIYDNIAKKSRMRKKAKEQVQKTVRNQIATRESLESINNRLDNMIERLNK